jgi:protoporphyrinogen oxidase
MPKTAIIIGAGPAGLTAALELLEHTDVIPIILESEDGIGGLSKTLQYKGNRLDIGPHRFFSKSDKVMDWWQNIMPVAYNDDVVVSYQNKQVSIHPKNKPVNKEEVMIVLDRLTRIYFLGKLFSYPIQLNGETIKNLGLWRITKIGFSYMKAQVFQRKPEKTLEDFFINRFGKELYLTFFKDYTEKVWGIPTSQISAEWGAQRVKGLSLTKAVKHLLFAKKKKKAGVEQKETETSLIEKFLYPKYGPGQMWGLVAKMVEERGGKILLNHSVKALHTEVNKVKAVVAINKINGEEITYEGDYFISTMPVKDLVEGIPQAPPEVVNIAKQLVYRDFIIVGILLKQLKLKNKDQSPIGDNWVYIQEKNVKLGRLQVYNNWGGGMVADPGTYWLGLEYFCNIGDEIWSLTDEAIVKLAAKELAMINIAEEKDVLDATVVRVPKTYPSYVGVYDKFDTVRNFLDSFENLFLVGRNGMHKYNNQDHSMLTAMQAVENIRAGVTDKSNIWSINTEQEYHEESAADKKESQ